MDGGKLLDNYLKSSNKKTKVNIANIFTRTLYSLIFLFGSLIYTNISDNNLVNYKKYVFENTFNFSNFKSLYNKIATSKKKDNVAQMVMGTSLDYYGVEKYLDGQKFLIDSESIIKPLAEGIVVFLGEKEGFNNTIIIQGSNGYDIWYGNLENVDVQIYDYVDNDKVLGSASDNLYILITKDSKYYTYEEYQNQI